MEEPQTVFDVVPRRPLMYIGTDDPRLFASAILDQLVREALVPLRNEAHVFVSLVVASDTRLTLEVDDPGLSVAEARWAGDRSMSGMFSLDTLPPPVVNDGIVSAIALSATELISSADGAGTRQRFVRGRPTRPLEHVGGTLRRGLRFTWDLDMTLTGGVGWPRDAVERGRRIAATSNAAARLTVTDLR